MKNYIPFGEIGVCTHRETHTWYLDYFSCLPCNLPSSLFLLHHFSKKSASLFSTLFPFCDSLFIVWVSHIWEIMWYLTFSVWLITQHHSLKICPFSTNDWVYPSSWLHNAPLWIYATFSLTIFVTGCGWLWKMGLSMTLRCLGWTSERMEFQG